MITNDFWVGLVCGEIMGLGLGMACVLSIWLKREISKK